MEWKWLPSECRELDVPQGVGASCVIPSFFTESSPMLIEVWPRLGHDTLDTTALSAAFDISFLGDKGDDKAYLGAGDDFVNGAQEADTVYGGDGRDWLRTGLDDDFIDGQGGGDELVGVDDNDTLFGGAGDDIVFSGDGSDTAPRRRRQRPAAAAATSIDFAWLFRGGRTYDCETVSYLD